VAHRETIYKISEPCVLYDPCCGAAYHLSVLTWLHGEHIREIIASDVDEKAVALAKRNLALLDTAGLNKRIDELSKMHEQYGKTSHEDALKSAHRLREKLSGQHPPETSVFQANVTDAKTILSNIKPKSVDIVFTDVPYGQHSNWQDSDVSNPLWSMLDSLLGVVSSSSIVAIVSDKQQKALHEGYQRIEQFQVGKRRIAILKPV
jgi:tRNA G10  N-methylase Trm11